MTKKKTEEILSKQQLESKERVERVAKVIDTLLKKEELALLPYLDATQSKIEARVRLVDIKEANEKETTKA